VISRDLFSRYVKDALANYYDPVHLQTHPLADLVIVSQQPSETRAQALRQQIRDAIDSLQPGPRVPYGGHEWLGYRLLWLRYIESRDNAEVCTELRISRTSFYRHHLEAFEAVVSVLWDRYSQSLAFASQTSPEDTLARQEAVRLAKSAESQLVDLNAVIKRTVGTIEPLATQLCVSIDVQLHDRLPGVYGSPTMLRQAVLNIMTEVVKLAPGSALTIVAEDRVESATWRIVGLAKHLASDILDVAGIAMSRSVLDVYGGRLWLETRGDETTISCSVPSAFSCSKPGAPCKILVIDDDSDTIELYQRYLMQRDYDVSMASDSLEAFKYLESCQPDAILLDVLMPREDGWDILQRLQSDPSTASIPVIICSVLSQPRLALALGAAQVLQKPISQLELLETVQRIVGLKHSQQTAS